MSEKTFKLAEVAKNNDSKKTWIVIHNSVYDVTAFLNEVSFFNCFNIFFICKSLHSKAIRWLNLICLCHAHMRK